MKFHSLIPFLALPLFMVASTPVDLPSSTTAVDVSAGAGVIAGGGVEARSLKKIADTGAYCWAISTGVLANPGYVTSLYNLHIQMLAEFNVPGVVNVGEYSFTSTRNNGVIWTGKVIVIAASYSFTIADAVVDLYHSLDLGSGIAARGGTAATRSYSSTNMGTFIEMVSMKNGGSTHSDLKREAAVLETRAVTCAAGEKEYADCCKIEIE